MRDSVDLPTNHPARCGRRTHAIPVLLLLLLLAALPLQAQNVREHNGVALPETPRFRQYLLSLDIDWRRIDTGSPVLDAILTALTFVKLPFHALVVTSQGSVKGYALYY